MVAQQKLKEIDCPDRDNAPSNGVRVNALNAENGGGSSPNRSKLAILKRSSTKSKTNGSPNDPFRFQGSGIDFKSKFIGQRDVAEPRGDVMCAEAMRLAKAAVKATGAHKQRVVLNISIDGLKLRDEKSGAVIENFPVSKISFIARDTTDARAFGFIFGTAEGRYRFYGIKTAQTADHAVLSIRDMFQVVFEMKKKQLQEAKQKQEELENMNNFQREFNGKNPLANGGGSAGGGSTEEACPVADLLDLETELENIEQGFHQLQNIPRMPDDQPFSSGSPWPGEALSFNDSACEKSTLSDPFGDSFNPSPVNQFTQSHPAQNGFHYAATAQQPVGPASWPAQPNGATFMMPFNHHHNLTNAGLPAQQLSGTNPFAIHIQQEQPLLTNGFSHLHQYGLTSSTAHNGHNGHVMTTSLPMKDPFDTQTAHRVISAIDTTHSYGLPPAVTQPRSVVGAPPPLPSVAPVVVQSPAPIDITTIITDGVLPSSGVGLFNDLDGKKTEGFDAFGHASFKREGPKPVSTLDAAFAKLVDIDQLLAGAPKDASTENGAAAVRKNPFEHIINPPKMSLNALTTAPKFTTNHHQVAFNSGLPAANGFHDASVNGGGSLMNGCKQQVAAAGRTAKSGRNDPFNGTLVSSLGRGDARDPILTVRASDDFFK